MLLQYRIALINYCNSYQINFYVTIWLSNFYVIILVEYSQIQIVYWDNILIIAWRPEDSSVIIVANKIDYD